MIELVVLSGKGGTGKTSVAAALVHLAAEEPGVTLSAVDADVDAANLALLLDPELEEESDFISGKVARLDPALCRSHRGCHEVCRFGAVIETPGGGAPEIDELACEGCAACVYACPQGAIAMQEETVGRLMRSTTRQGPLYHAALFPGAENSGKLVMAVRHLAREGAKADGTGLLITDGPPGIGCPVVSAITGADAALIVTEPGLAGGHDLARIVETVRHFSLPATICINKADLLPEGVAEIDSYARSAGIEITGIIPWDEEVIRAVVAGRPVTALPDSTAARALTGLWERLHTLLLA
jgi:MinD superfamily P-loop ATPase